MALELTSPAFDDGESISEKFTCDGVDVSPRLEVGGVPEETESLALVADDPDAPAGTWVHWVLYGLPAALRELPEGVPPEEEVLGGARQGTNDFGNPGYGGPVRRPAPPTATSSSSTRSERSRTWRPVPRRRSSWRRSILWWWIPAN